MPGPAIARRSSAAAYARSSWSAAGPLVPRPLWVIVSECCYFQSYLEGEIDAVSAVFRRDSAGDADFGSRPSRPLATGRRRIPKTTGEPRGANSALRIG